MGAIKDTYDVGQQIVRAFGSVLKGLRVVPFIGDILDWLERRFLNPIVVRRVTDPHSADLLSALELYDQRIPEEQRLESVDIIRWVREDQEHQRLRPDDRRDYFLVAKFRKKVCGFSFFTFYGAQSLVFFAYLVAAKSPGTSDISKRLISYITRMIRKRPLRQCKGFVLELEDPRRGTKKSETAHSLARIALFCQLAEACGFTLRAVDIPYLQPPLTHSMCTQDDQEQLLLMCAYPGAHGARGRIPKEELTSLLEFIYLDVS